MPDVILFDVNETLLDTRALDPLFGRVFGAAGARERWFQQLQVLWLVTIATGEFVGFTTLAEAALQMRAEQDRVSLSARDRAELAEGMSTLPPFPDSAPALERLMGAGLRLAALSNGDARSTRVQLRHAGLEGFFEEVFGADQVKRFKPAPEPYQMVVRRLGVAPKDIRLVAAHDWDVAGAHAAGLRTAFVARPGQALNPAGTPPDMQADDLLTLADVILK